MITSSRSKLKKLSKLTRVEELRVESSAASNNVDIPDIEDTPAIFTKSQYFFSPIQTRQQRIKSAKPPKTTEEITSLIKPTRTLPLDEKDVVHAETAVQIRKENETKGSSNTKLKKIKLDKLVTKQEATNSQDISVTIEEDVKPEISEVKSVESNWEPNNWQETLTNIRLMRSHFKAPVDTMGCDSCADDNVNEKTQRFHKLVALMLSSQTKDATTYKAVQKLKANQLTPESIKAMEITHLVSLLNPVSFYKNKAKYLQLTSQILIEKYNSDIPNNIKELVSLPGVGPKMAHICMATAWNECTGIGVDVHVHRISNRLKWVPKETKEPEQTRRALEAWLPRELWLEINHLLVGFGQTICTPLRPHCVDCLNRNICPSADINNKTPSKTTTESGICPIKKAKLCKTKIQL